MAVTKKKSLKNKVAFAGIVVAGTTKAEAVANYRLVASGKQSDTLRSGDDKYQMVTLSNTDGDFYNPLTGIKDLSKVDVDLISNSGSSNDPASVFMTVCADSCGNIIISDSSKVVNFCPSCSSAIPELSDTEIESLSDDQELDTEDSPTGYQGVIVHASTYKEAENLYLEAMSGENISGVLDTYESDPDGLDNPESALSFNSHAKCDVVYSPFFGEASVIQSKGVEDLLSVEAKSSEKPEGFSGYYLVCSDEASCGMHILASSNESVFCPKCSASVLDPEDMEDMEDTSLSSDSDGYDTSESMDHEDEDEDEKGEDVDVEFGEDEDEDEDEEHVHKSESMGHVDEDDEDDDEDDDDDDEEHVHKSESMGHVNEDEDEDGLNSDDFDEEVSTLDDEEFDPDQLEDGEDLESDSNTRTASLDLLQIISSNTGGKLDPKLLNVSHCGQIQGIDTWTAFYDGFPVALSRANDVPEAVSKIFNNPRYGEAVYTAAKETGVLDALASMGFKTVKPDVTLEVAVSQSILDEAELISQKALASVDAQKSGLVESFSAALSTAAMGINRGVFVGISNPIKDNLICALSSAGIRDPSSLVSSAFESGSDSYSKILITKALDINSKSLDVQNQIAESVSQSNFLSESRADTQVEPIGKIVPGKIQSDQNLESVSSNPQSIQTAIRSLNLSKNK
jgi:hypothetical protein